MVQKQIYLDFSPSCTVLKALFGIPPLVFLKIRTLVNSLVNNHNSDVVGKSDSVSIA